ncbi:MAG: hypothetical protein AB7O45_16090 [Alphaproteobacteria bacterium]
MIRFAFALALLAAGSIVASAGEVRIKNCVGSSGSRVTVYGYNEGDTVYLIAYSQIDIAHADTGTVTCGTGNCRVRIAGAQQLVPFGPLTGGSEQCVMQAPDVLQLVSPQDAWCSQWCRP